MARGQPQQHRRGSANKVVAEAGHLTCQLSIPQSFHISETYMWYWLSVHLITCAPHELTFGEYLRRTRPCAARRNGGLLSIYTNQHDNCERPAVPASFCKRGGWRDMVSAHTRKHRQEVQAQGSARHNRFPPSLCRKRTPQIGTAHSESNPCRCCTPPITRWPQLPSPQLLSQQKACRSTYKSIKEKKIDFLSLLLLLPPTTFLRPSLPFL